MVLSGGTLLAAQVQSDLDQGVERRMGELEAPGGAPPLKLNDFKLPSDMPFDLPEGSEISPDLSKLKIPNDLDLTIPGDLDLSDLDFELPEDFKLELPEGTIFSPPGLELPEGGTIKLPDGRQFELPKGSKLDLPPELVDRLLEQGVPVGLLNAARELDINGLPPDLHARLDPPQFEGGGKLRLPAGTEISLPDGRQFPFAAGALAYAARYVLPAGTSFDIPYGAEGRDGVFPVPRPNSPSQLLDGSGDPAGAPSLVTEITGMPARVRKGEAVTVTGYVRDPSGRAVGGAPVDVFMNETKASPGELVGQGVSDVSGTFRITLDLPTDKPARQYQLVNHASAFVDSSGRAWGDGWGDPPFSTFAGTSIKLELPARDGLGVATAIAGVLSDDTGLAVPSASVLIVVDGTTVARPTTNAQGRFSATYTFPAGTHAVDAQYLGSSYYEASSARGSITIDSFAIELRPSIRAQPGETILLSGRTLGQGAVAPERAVTISGVFGDSLTLTSDSAGRFTYSYATSATQAPGAYMLTYRMPEHNVTKTQLVELDLTGRITITVPDSWDVESPVPVGIALTNARTGGPLAGQYVELTLSGPGGTSGEMLYMNEAGSASTMLAPLRASPGTYTLAASLVRDPYVSAPLASATITLDRFDVAWSIPDVVVRGTEASGAVTVRLADRPYSNMALQLDLLGSRQIVTDASGRATWTIFVPSSVDLGVREIAVTAADHPRRTSEVQIVAATKLDLAVPARFAAGDAVQASLTLVDDRGDPVRGAKVTLTGPGLATTVSTDARGRWSGPLNLSTRGGNVTMSAAYESAVPYLGTQTFQTMSATAPVATLARNLWLYPLVLGAAVAAGGGAWYAVKKMPRRTRAISAAAAAPIAMPAASASDFELRFGIPNDEPAVWGVGEPLTLVLRNRGAADEFDLAWSGGTARVRLAADAQGQTTLTFAEEGDVVLTARRRSAPSASPVEGTVRIVDYRKETAREFDLFLEKARGVDASLTRQSTPREIVWTLGARWGADTEAQLDEIALVMEVTNYSHYEISRQHYLRFVRASRALDAFFAPRATLPASGG